MYIIFDPSQDELSQPFQESLNGVKKPVNCIFLQDPGVTCIEDIVFFDMEDINIEKTQIIKEKEILLINSDYEFFFTLAI